MSSVNAVPFLATGSDLTAVALKTFSGSATESFRQNSVLFGSGAPYINVRSGNGSKSSQFLMYARLPRPEEGYVPGDELIGQAYAVDEGEITVDDTIAAHQYIPFDQLNIAHFNVLMDMGAMQGAEIGRTLDRRLFALMALAARQPSRSKNGLIVHLGGNRVLRQGSSVVNAYPLSSTGVERLRADLAALGYQMDVDNVPAQGRGIYLHVGLKNVLMLDERITNRDFINATNNSIVTNEYAEAYGFRILGFLNDDTINADGPLPSLNVTSGPAKFRGNFSLAQTNVGQPVAIAVSAPGNGLFPIGMLEYQAITSILERHEKVHSWFAKTSVQTGLGIMHPQTVASIEIAQTVS